MKYLKRFNESNSYYQDDINVDITSTVIDILQDLVDEGLTIQCFTSGYITLKQAGVKYTENDISLFIMANDDDDFAMSNWEWYKTLDYNKLIPYLERVITYIEDQDRHVDISFQWRPKTKRGWGLLREYNFEYRLFNGEINKELESIPDNNYETISMKFKLKKMKYLKRFNESNQSDVISQEFDDIFGELDVSLAYQEGGFLEPDKIACYICSDEYTQVSIADVEELVLHFISFMISEMDTKLISLGIKPFDKHFKTRLKNFYNEEPNRWGVHHPYYKGGNLNDLFDIQDFDKNEPFDWIELKFKKL